MIARHEPGRRTGRPRDERTGAVRQLVDVGAVSWVEPYWLFRVRNRIAAPPLHHSWQPTGSISNGFWRELTRDVVRPYRPELHYMRGPGPAWRAKHGVHPAA